MLDRKNNRFILVPGQYGFIAPSQDRDGVEELFSHGFATCFAISVTDREKVVAMLAHVDYPADRNCANLIPESIELFHQYGAKKLIVETANLVDLNDGSILTRSSESFVTQFTTELRKSGLIVTRMPPQGRARFVSTTPLGLKIVTDSRTPEQKLQLSERSAAVFRERFMGAAQRGGTTIKRAYVPNLVLPSS